MMGREQAQNNSYGIDEHDQPTEPMGQIVLTPYGSPTYMPGAIANEPTIPAAQPDARPVPWQEMDRAAPAGPWNYPPHTPATPVYPVLPPAPGVNGKGRPAGGAEPVVPEGGRTRWRARQPRRSFVPILVGFCFVLVQLLLLARVVFTFLGTTASNVWLSLLFNLSDLCVLPVRLLLDNIKVAVPLGAELLNYLALLLAILVYGVLSRILVRFLKALLNSR